MLSRLGLALSLLLLTTPVWAQPFRNGDLTMAGKINGCDATGSSNAYVCTLSYPMPAYRNGQCYVFKANHTNTGAATLNVSGLGAKTLKKYTSGASADLEADDIVNGKVISACYDGTNMQVISLGGGGGGGGSGDITQVGAVTSGAAGTTGAPLTGLFLGTETAPSTPAASQGRVYFDTTQKNVSVKDDAGVIKHMMQTRATSADQWVTGWNAAGLATLAQPAFSNLSGTATNAQVPATLSGKRITPRMVALTNAASVTPDANTTDIGYLTALSQTTQIENPNGTPDAGQRLLLFITSSAVRTLTWGTAYATNLGIPLPTSTTGGGATDLFGFVYHPTSAKWEMMATSQSSLAARRRTCMILMGADNAGSPLTDSDLGPQLHQCVVPSAATVEEITVYADAGTPNVIVHRRTGSTNTALLSSALATGASGGVACARASAIAGYAGTTCSAILQNVSIGSGDTIGLTSGTAGGTAKRMTVAVSYILSN